MGDRSVASDIYASPWAISPGDCRLALLAYDGETFDSCVTDPPYELGFMGKAWDASGVAFDPETWRQVFRVLKPGAHLLAFGGTRTYHRMVAAIEDIGFEIRDCITWHYGSGFPKSHNLSGEHEGWGTALKPASEPIVVARKPFRGTVAQNVAKHGTGAINVAGCRVDSGPPRTTHADGSFSTGLAGYEGGFKGMEHDVPAGRWPPNVLLTHSADCVRVGERSVECKQIDGAARTEATDEGKARGYGSMSGSRGLPSTTETVPAYDCAPDCPVALMDRQSGDARSAYPNNPAAAANYAGADVAPGIFGGDKAGASYSDSGGASRFFPTFEWSAEDDAPFMYCAKAATAERDAGLSHRARKRVTSKINRGNGTGERFDGGPTATRANDHPTVKPIALMRWLCRLVTPKGGLILEPFAGSGTTIVAALREGMRARGVELDAKHIEFARERIAEDSPLFNRTGT